MPMKSLLLRPIRLVAITFALVLTLALAALALFTSLDFSRVESIRAHVNRTYLLQSSLTALKDVQLQVARGGSPPAAELEKVRSALTQSPIRGGPIRSFTRERLGR